MATLSVVISAYNEADKIEKCLSSLSFADEIVVVDHESSDTTLALAKKHTPHVFSQKNNPFLLDLQKNFGFEKAKSDWILSLDADEQVSPELAQEITSLLNHEPQPTSHEPNGYFIPRKNMIFGKWIAHTGWYPDHQLRLFRKGKGKYTKEHVHEHLEVEGKVEYLQEHILHDNYESIAQFLQKMSNYTVNEANEYLKKGYTVEWLDAIRFPVKEFISRFFAREGYKDGFHGLMLSLFMAFYHFVIFAYIWEKQGFKESEVSLAKLEKEGKKISKDFSYWLANEQIKHTRNAAKKVYLKVKRKISV